ncbi:hypothetical protein [Paeniglutamicibacter cryotolerans]|uniref:Uncharacterized protein n=1 Tax=Paeniglutamicibacter cryotolerans TaxID=670079 RepID=A0A839QVI6_9MICC|nr:hypothetical protein [Paeniglutamicibacter cryotolerans]MBB2997312.1 hypothetical protein [Paeniglutamicibacter cryotolerans]
MLEIGFFPGTTLNVAMFVEMQQQYFARNHEADAPVFVDVSGLDGVAGGVAERFSHGVARNRVALLGSGPTDRVLARFLMGKLGQKHHCAYFERYATARDHVLNCN